MKLTLGQIHAKGFQILVCSFESRWHTLPRKQSLIWNNKNKLECPWNPVHVRIWWSAWRKLRWNRTHWDLPPYRKESDGGPGWGRSTFGRSPELLNLSLLGRSKGWTDLNSETHCNVFDSQPGTIAFILNSTLAPPSVNPYTHHIQRETCYL